MGEEDSALSVVNVRNGGASEKTTCVDHDSRNVAIEAGSI